MNRSNLWKLRVFLSIIFILPITIILADFSGLIPSSIINWITYFQFVPSILKSFTFFSYITTGFIVVIILTALFGRIYCSSICPLGILQDIVNFISRKIAKKRKKKNYRQKYLYIKENKILRWTLVVIPTVLLVFGISLGINLLDPYSLYGRIIGNFIRPVVIGINNITAFTLESFKVYAIFPYDLKVFNLIPFVITLSFFLLVLVMSIIKGRLYCNTICPVGTVLGVISKYSLYKIVIENEECINCGICEKDCKANCIDSEKMKVDLNRCVACFNCISSCPTDGIKFEHSLPKFNNRKDVFDQTKRNFLIASGIYISTLSALLAQAKKKIVATKPSTVPVFRKFAVSPPGSISLDKFNSKCTSCHLCVSSCPTQVLQPSFLEYGFTGMLQPRLDNLAGFCNYDCVICSEVCPTGAILPINAEKKKLTQLGKAKFVKENCIVETEKTDCGACSEHCPTKAVHMIPYQGKLFIPETRDEFCIGCGACEYACPTIPYKAIYVEGNAIHQTAKKNEEKDKPIQKIDYKEEFPF
ncbi:MAG: 4Fe-4S binding protein [Ignavibacteria bacterium]|nr:4Fe-4S binding protein [Ignavibacteria bacterium]